MTLLKSILYTSIYFNEKMGDERLNIIDTYRRKLRNHHVESPLTIAVWDGFAVGNQLTITLDCWVITKETKGAGFNSNGGKWQYDLGLVDGERRRPMAWRVPFLMDPHYSEADYTCSHLCHNDQCYNPIHIVLEPLAVNKARNGCPGGAHCHHVVTCLRPGPYYNQ